MSPEDVLNNANVVIQGQKSSDFGSGQQEHRGFTVGTSGFSHRRIRCTNTTAGRPQTRESYAVSTSRARYEVTIPRSSGDMSRNWTPNPEPPPRWRTATVLEMGRRTLGSMN